MKAKRRDSEWVPIPTFTVPCPRDRKGQPVASRSGGLALPAGGTDAAKAFIDQRIAEMFEAFIADEEGKTYTPPEPHEHADYYYDGKKMAPDELKRYLANPNRHIHGFSTPRKPAGGRRDYGGLAFDATGEGLIGNPGPLERASNPYRLPGGSWSNHFGDWDRAVRLIEDGPHPV